MPELVMASWFCRVLLAWLIGSAALSGNARPVEDQSRFVRTQEAPAPIISGGFPSRWYRLFLIS